MKLKKGLVATGLSIALLASAGSALAATKYGPFSPVVPRLGGNWYSATHPASGSIHAVEMGSIGGNKAILVLSMTLQKIIFLMKRHYRNIILQIFQATLPEIRVLC